jgi:kynurenine formamidase
MGRRGRARHSQPDQRREAPPGLAISCARLLLFAPKAPVQEARLPPVHFMQRSGESADAGSSSAFDWIGMPLHGLYPTHIDAMSHVFWDGRMYNGRPAGDVPTDRGALQGGVDLARHGIITRGILLDVPAVRGDDFLQFDDFVTAADLTAAEERVGARAEPGDVILIRTGYGARRSDGDVSSVQPGLAPECIDWIAARSPAAIGTDTGTDCVGPWYAQQEVPDPVHVVALAAMGMWIIDGCELEELAAACALRDRHQFLLCIAPLRLKNATGSPVNPIAIL